jgi:hypothetical protein
MPVKERISKAIPRQEVPPFVEHWLQTGERSAEFFFAVGDERALWDMHADRIVRKYAQQHPGTRPLLWWRFDAPEPRRRLGGTGTPMHECSNHVAAYVYGVPQSWRKADQTYLHSGTPLSDSDPPVYEAEATFLRRHSLLLPGEARRIPRRDFEPLFVRRVGDQIGTFRT